MWGSHSFHGMADIDFPVPREAIIDRTAAIAEWSNADTQQTCLEHMSAFWVPDIIQYPPHPHTDLSPATTQAKPHNVRALVNGAAGMVSFRDGKPFSLCASRSRTSGSRT
jgi:hypothetical protein